MRKNSKTGALKGRDLKVADLYREKKEELSLRLLSGKKGLQRKILTFDVGRPGLFFAGFRDYFPEDRIQLLGESEIAYLSTKEKKVLEKIAREFMSTKIPAVIVTNEKKIPEIFEKYSEEMGTPLFLTTLKGSLFAPKLIGYLMEKLALTMTVHGTLVDVFGVGLLLTGKSGIGKSECALDLIQRGHKLVADDVIKLTHFPDGVLKGSSATDDPLLRHFIEIRGVGLVDVFSLYGIQAVRDDKQVEIHVELVEWSKGLDYERVGLEEKFSEFLGVKIPYLLLPLNPGKNIATILEVIAMSYHLRHEGLSAPSYFEKTIIEKMKREKNEH